MKRLTNSLLSAALVMAAFGAVGCDLTSSTPQVADNVPDATPQGAVTFFVEGMV